MKIILREDVEKLGKAGEIVKVRDGFGRNFLVPKGMAVVADTRNVRVLDHEKRTIAARSKKIREAAASVAEKVSALTLTLAAKVGEEGKLFGAITSRDIADALAAAGFAIDRKNVLLDEPIKQIGVYKVKVKLASDIVPEVSVTVAAE